MTGTGVKNQIDAAEGQAPAGALGDPSVFADLKADLHPSFAPAAIEVQVANRIELTIAGEGFNYSLRPGLEPAQLIVDAVAGQKALDHKAGDAAVGQKRGRVEHGILIEDWQPHRDNQAARLRNNLLEDLPGRLLDPG